MTDIPHKNRGLKTAFAIAIVLGLVGGGLFYLLRSHEITIPLSVRFANLPQHHVIVGKLPKIEVRIKGPSGLIQSLKDNPLIHEIDFEGVESGRRVVAFSPEQIPLRQGARILEINPMSITVQIDERTEKRVPVVPDLINDPVPGYIVASVITTPATIQLVGPASFLEKISAIRTTPIDLSGITAPLKKTVALNVRDGISVIPEEHRLVLLSIDIQDKIIEKSILLPIQGSGSDYRVTIRPALIALLVKGPEITVEKVAQGIGIKAWVDLKGLGPGIYSRPAVIEPPLNTTIIKAEPTVFQIEIFQIQK